MNTAEYLSVNRIVLQQALDGLLSMAEVMYRAEISTVPSERFKTWKASILALSDQLGVPQYVVFRDARHAAAELVSQTRPSGKLFYGMTWLERALELADFHRQADSSNAHRTRSVLEAHLQLAEQA